eukprot:3656459-Lingulodinium_polyedra.AAC.1
MLHSNSPLPPVDVDLLPGPDLDGPSRQGVKPDVGTLEVRSPQVLGDEPLLKIQARPRADCRALSEPE